MRWMLLGLLGVSSLSLAAPTAPVKLLLVTKTAGFRHGSCDVAKIEVPALGQRSGLFEAKVTEDVADLEPDSLNQYQVVLFFTTGELPMSDAAKANLLAWVKRGGGFLGMHSSTDTFYRWPEYGELVGGYFDGHPWNQVVNVKIDDPQHPAVEHLGAEFQILEEVYQYRNWSRDKVHVLMTLDNASVDVNAAGVKRADKDFGITWCKDDEGAGRVFVSGLGHHDGAWRDPRVHQMLLGAVKWLTKSDWRSDPALQALVKAADVDGLVAAVGASRAAWQDEPVKALGSLGTPAAAAKLAQLGQAGRPLNVRLAAIAALARPAGGDPAPLLVLAGDPDPLVRAAVCTALGQQRAAAAEPALVKATQDAVAEVRLAAVQALGKLATPGAKTALLAALRAPDENQRRAALSALTATDPATRGALLELLRTTPQTLGDSGAAMVDKLAAQAGETAVYEVLAGLLGSAASGATKQAALRAVARSGRPEAGELLTRALFATDDNLRRAAIAALTGVELGTLGGKLTPHVRAWKVIGPFANPNGQDAHDTAYGPETSTDPTAEFDGAKGKVTWKDADAPNGRLNLRQAIANGDNFAGYAACTIVAPAALTCELRIGSDDGAKAWLNGQLIYNRKAFRGLVVDDERVTINLQPGPNRLLVKVLQGAGDWLLTARLARAEGGLEGLKLER
ncbi:MAG: ThuA domain-containing protein [Fimbriimonadaceae bacterium]|nr:ThuA domain-containing protein [Fimbriimonadaceae bacterium]